MEHFVGTWKLVRFDFEKMKKFYASLGLPAAVLDAPKERWDSLKLEVTGDGTIWKHCNFPRGDETVTFDLEHGTSTRMGSSGQQTSPQGSFKMEDGVVFTEESVGGDKKLTGTKKVDGDDMILGQTFGDISVETVFKKCE
ncbi:uncharacterized protein [Branchiostoma lanceolatum]|uniref:uncharacterized protein isoform X1 n=1 Tax=Branchiostoma lanceolatum TaxID=7740 RepID=UPI003454C933